MSARVILRVAVPRYLIPEFQAEYPIESVKRFSKKKKKSAQETRAFIPTDWFRRGDEDAENFVLWGYPAGAIEHGSRRRWTGRFLAFLFAHPQFQRRLARPGRRAWRLGVVSLCVLARQRLGLPLSRCPPREMIFFFESFVFWYLTDPSFLYSKTWVGWFLILHLE